MYLFLGCLLVIALAASIFFHCRRRKACRKLTAMSCEEKCDTLRGLIEPFGYCYKPSQDIFSTTIDAPQRTFGYTALFDRYAPLFNMVFDCMPVYFDYRERTWLIEFWKGQYGVNSGCEAGIYHADTLVASIFRKSALFHSVTDAEMLPVSIRLLQNGTELACVCRRHWWLTAFRAGAYCEPEELSVQVCITFPDREMLSAFAQALREQWDVPCRISGLQLQLLFDRCTSCGLPFLRKLICRFSQWQNRCSCRLFLWATRPFSSGMDRVLFLYFLLPPLFRRIFRDKKRRKCCRKCCRHSKKCPK